MKKLLIKEIKKEFFPYTNEEAFEKALLKNFKDGSDANINYYAPSYFYILPAYGKKIIMVIDKELLIIFIQGKKDLVVLLISDYDGFHNTVDLKNLITRSVTTVDVIASDKWSKENKEIKDIISLISKEKSHIGMEYIIKDDPEYSLETVQSPLLWYLLKEDLCKTSGYKQSSKTKETFVQGAIRVIVNSLDKKLSIFDKDMTKIKKGFHNEIVSLLLSDTSRKFFIEDLKSRNGLILIQNILSPLFSSLKYNRDEFDNFINGEILSFLQEDLKDFIYNEITSIDYNPNFLKKIVYNITRKNNIDRKDKKLNYKEIEFILLNNDRETYHIILEKLMLLIDTEFSKPIFSNKYEKRSIEKVEIPFCSRLYTEILATDRSLIDLPDTARRLDNYNPNVIPF